MKNRWMKPAGWMLTLLLCTACINTESPEVDEEEEAGWWCSFYNNCNDKSGSGNGFYGTTGESGQKANQAGSTSSADSAHVD